MQKKLPFEQFPITVAQANSPEGYAGLYAFHKYWGKKPHETIAYVIEQLTHPGEIVVDPFVGSGSAAREAVRRGRRFVGFDISPVAVELARFITNPAEPELVFDALRFIEAEVKDSINQTYVLNDGETATHYLWNAERLTQVWVKGNAGKSRRELQPTRHDLALIESFLGYRSRFIRCPRFFSNGRINAAPEMTLDSLLTPRAQRNIDLLIDAIGRCPKAARVPMRLCLTAASGQMTRMVFAVTGRGKTKNETSEKVEVGSWVIGYWRPRLHFEVNVWNCFENRTRKLLNALRKQDAKAMPTEARTPRSVLQGKADYFIGVADCRRGLRGLSGDSVSLIITDPPHSDRVPYLELSEFWNSLLGETAAFEDEIVISNAKERGKDQSAYDSAMREFFRDAARVLSDDGHLIVLFNGRERDAWAAIRECAATDNGNSLSFIGCFPCAYSAHSVIQDNRKGAMKSDWALVFSRNNSTRALNGLKDMAGWNASVPELMAGDK